MGYTQEAYDAECAALTRALGIASRKQRTPGRVTIRRMASEERSWPRSVLRAPGKKAHPALRRARPDIAIEIRCCPAHKGVPGNEKADEWAKLTAEDSDAHGVEWLGYSDQVDACVVSLPRSFAHLKRDIPEKKWAETRRGRWERGGLQEEVQDAKQAGPRRHGCGQLQEAHLEVLPADPSVDEEPPYCSVLVVPLSGAEAGSPLQGVPREEGPAEDPVGRGTEGELEGGHRFKFRDLLADGRCA